MSSLFQRKTLHNAGVFGLKTCLGVTVRLILLFIANESFNEVQVPIQLSVISSLGFSVSDLIVVFTAELSLSLRDLFVHPHIAEALSTWFTVLVALYLGLSRQEACAYAVLHYLFCMTMYLINERSLRLLQALGCGISFATLGIICPALLYLYSWVPTTEIVGWYHRIRKILRGRDYLAETGLESDAVEDSDHSQVDDEIIDPVEGYEDDEDQCAVDDAETDQVEGTDISDKNARSGEMDEAEDIITSNRAAQNESGPEV